MLRMVAWILVEAYFYFSPFPLEICERLTVRLYALERLIETECPLSLIPHILS